jgi:hypothetical protein
MIAKDHGAQQAYNQKTEWRFHSGGPFMAPLEPLGYLLNLL